MNKNTQSTTIGLAALLLGLSAHGAVSTEFNGLNLGGALGGLSTSADFGSSYNFNTFEGSQSIEDSNESSQQSSLWSAHLGYGGTVYDWPLWLGLEIFVNNADKDLVGSMSFEEIPGAQFTVESNLNRTEYGFDFRPGVLATETTLIYARVGAAFNTLAISAGDNAPSFDDSSKKVLGLRLGAGLEQKLSCQLSFSLDYIYTGYGDVESSLSALRESESDIFEIAFSQEASNVHSHAVMLGATYYPMVKHNCR